MAHTCFLYGIPGNEKETKSGSETDPPFAGYGTGCRPALQGAAAAGILSGYS